VLLFGAQDIAGDTFAIGLAEPIDKSDPNLVLNMSLGISYGYQQFGGSQYSIVNVNTLRMTTSAGGEDDGDHTNGALLTVGGLDDSNANPSPYATPSNPRTDDELYNLLPFVSNGDTSINVYTKNPSNDDNIFFASLFLASTTAVVGEGILLAPVSASNPVGSQHTVTATVQDDDGNPVVGRDVTFTIVSGPHAGQTSTVPTDVNGKATFTYTGTSAGTDVIEASFVDSEGNTIISNQVTKEWIIVNEPPKAHAGPNQTVEQDSLGGASVTLDGSGSSDPDGDPLTYKWTWASGSATGVSPIVSLPLGTTTITLVVNDGTVDSDPDTVVITVQDTTPPVITCPPNETVEQESAAGTVVPLTATATDICDADPTITSDELAIYPLGTTIVTFTATDDSGNSATCTTTVIVEDTTPPDLSVTVSPDTLWPPNHKMVNITATVIVSDICDAAPTVVLTNVTSDEPDNAIGIGDGNTINDIQGAEIGTEDYEFQLRAERAGTGDGRIYTITYTVTDASGNSASEIATVVVPHDMD
jgi:hypothetical protein